jgi:hypothetical protein
MPTEELVYYVERSKKGVERNRLALHCIERRLAPHPGEVPAADDILAQLRFGYLKDKTPVELTLNSDYECRASIQSSVDAALDDRQAPAPGKDQPHAIPVPVGQRAVGVVAQPLLGDVVGKRPELHFEIERRLPRKEGRILLPPPEAQHGRISRPRGNSRPSVGNGRKRPAESVHSFPKRKV